MFCFWRKLYQGLAPYQPLSPGGLYAGTQEHLQLSSNATSGQGFVRAHLRTLPSVWNVTETS